MGTIKKISSFTSDDFNKMCSSLDGELRSLWVKHEKNIKVNFNASKDIPVLLSEITRPFFEDRSYSNGLLTEDLSYVYKLDSFKSVLPKGMQLSNWCFKDFAYQHNGANSDDEIKLLILECLDNERIKFERLKNKFSSASSQNDSRSRQPISESVRITVWRRDGGRCVKCESRENLEYDHIVPISKGGSNTVRNIELLCERCNREKSDKIV